MFNRIGSGPVRFDACMALSGSQHSINSQHRLVQDSRVVPQFIPVGNMSTPEFYIQNGYGIDPCNPNSTEFYTIEGAFYSTGVAEAVRRDPPSRTAASSWPLNESELDYSAQTRGWNKIYGLPASPPMASYRREGVRLNFWLTTGMVGSYLEHPCQGNGQGNAQLFQRDVTMEEANDVFSSPRNHTGRGCHTKQHHQVGRKRKATSSDNGYRKIQVR